MIYIPRDSKHTALRYVMLCEQQAKQQQHQHQQHARQQHPTESVYMCPTTLQAAAEVSPKKKNQLNESQDLLQEVNYIQNGYNTELGLLYYKNQ